jgi:hypothetical protein
MPFAWSVFMANCQIWPEWSAFDVLILLPEWCVLKDALF